ncbi:hypothetical protein PDE_07169 [Penicillium oxalicum 114-2]|uniref:Uncharacterized protein n=1 Tax=Penicillium oxalicum (strain 114-2 / CGMCC 5302) TaxID=933388 RepID=S7ZP98_PENO1|nr:hypothetical protein PDE_07169 [Penicillium oxalicum 114-2]
MAFWADWALWEKLSFALALLIVMVFVYAFCVLAFNTWKIRRYTDAELRQKDKEAELHPILSNDIVPFGAKALERRVYVEGIWVSPLSTPLLSTLPSETPSISPLSPSPERFSPRSPTPASSVAPEEVKEPQAVAESIAPTDDSFERESLTVHPPRGGIGLDEASERSVSFPETKQTTILPGQACDDIPQYEQHDAKRVSFHTRVRHVGSVSEADLADSTLADITNSLDPSKEADAPPQNEKSRLSRISRVLRKRSSEEFRRKMSALFNEQFRMDGPADQLQIDPPFRHSRSRKRRKSTITQSHSLNL